MSKTIRNQLAIESARLMALDGISDFHKAKMKAAQRLGISGKKYLPGNDEIVLELKRYQNLFNKDKVLSSRKNFYSHALKAMRGLDELQPRLALPELNEHMQHGHEIELHVTADTVEEVILVLMQRNIPYQQGIQKISFDSGNLSIELPSLSLYADEQLIKIVIFIPPWQKKIPYDSGKKMPMRRLNLKQFEEEIAAEASE